MEELQKLFPSAFSNGKVNLEILRELLGDRVDSYPGRYELNWPGKGEARRLAEVSSTFKFHYVEELSLGKGNSDHLYIEGDNLEALKLLQKEYFNKIKMIYIDPPYNTGQDFIYKDNFRSNRNRFMKLTNQLLRKEAGSWGRYHSDWLNFIYPRIKVARDLLKEDGVLFVSIDDHEFANLKLILDELFGEDNFVGNIVRATGTTTGQDSGGLGSSFDYLLMYRKSDRFHVGGIPLSKKDAARFKLKDNRGKFSILQLRKTGNDDKREDRPNMYYPVTAPNGDLVYPLGPGGYESRWRMGREKYLELEKDDFIYWKKVKDKGWIPYVKYYLDGRTKRPSTLWDDIDGNKKASLEVKKLLGEKIFDFPKPVQLIKRCIQIANAGEEDIILDFFSGSGTTAQAVLELNVAEDVHRKFIMVQLPEKIEEDTSAYRKGYKTICDIGRKRITMAAKRIAVKIQDSDRYDLGFKTFKLERNISTLK